MEIDQPILEQLALADFINDGGLERHIRKMNAIHAQVRRTLIDLLIKHFGENIWIPKESGGTHILVRFRLNISDEVTLRAAEAAKSPMSKSTPIMSANQRKKNL
jgi:GntR family transcriptional regulator / MocR family aminotransferase